MHRAPKTQQGFSLIAALFLLIVLSALGVVAVRLTAIQQQTVVLAMQSARAFSAASAGTDWSAYQALVNGTCANSTFALTESGLSGFSVATTCNSTTHTEGADTIRVYVIEAFAWTGSYGTPDYVSRRLRATFTDAT